MLPGVLRHPPDYPDAQAHQLLRHGEEHEDIEVSRKRPYTEEGFYAAAAEIVCLSRLKQVYRFQRQRSWRSSPSVMPSLLAKRLNQVFRQRS